MQKFIPIVTMLGLLGASSAAAVAAANVEDQVGGPIADGAKFVVSLRGAHLATVAKKGSRVNVIVDGVAGPRFDEIVETTWGAIDPRPYENGDPNSQARGGPVSFSKDGSRYAYLARLGQEWVLMVDNKESLRIPVAGAVGATAGVAGGEGNHEIRIEFSGESGKHLLFARSTYGGFELWVDGQKWPGFYNSGGGGSEGTIDPIISPDGEHIAYVAQIDREKRVLIVDGKAAGYFGEHLQFTPDSKHLISLAQTPKGQAVLIDGKSLFAARQIVHVFVPPIGNRLIFVLTRFSKDGNSSEGTFLMVDGKPVEASLTAESDIARVIFSPDGKRYAAICGKAPNQFVVIDGKKGQEYYHINDRDVATLSQGITFSPDSSKVVYIASTNTPGVHDFVVINEEESDALQNPWFRFSPDGKRIAYGGALDQAQQKWLLMIDGQRQPLMPGWYAQGFTFSPDGSRFAYVGAQGGNSGIFLDGKNTAIGGDFAFSPDSKHFAVVGGRPADNKYGLLVDGQLVFEIARPLLNRAFTPDSQHLFWMAVEPAIGAKAAPGIYEYVVYVDGKPVARCDNIANAQGDLRNLYGFGTVSWKMPPAWNLKPDGALMFLGPVDDGVKRLTVTPAADTSVDTMIEEAKAAPARAAAKAAEDKKKADEAAAAKKAKAAAADADAAAKAKAEYDARVAKQKADYDAAVAKKKADYDAAIAKRKADYDAAMAKKKADYDAAVAAKAELLKQQQQNKP